MPDQQAKHPGPPPQTSQRRWVWWVVLCTVVIVAGYGLYVARRPGQPVSASDLGNLESFCQDQGPAQGLCRRLDIPDLPDITDLDAQTQEWLHGLLVALFRNPEDAACFGRLAAFYEALNDKERAAGVYRRAVAIAPDQPEWAYRLASRLSANGNAEQALPFLNRAIEANPKDPWGYIYRARIFDALERTEDLEADLGRFRTRLTEPGDLESFRSDQGNARLFLSKLGLPELPDISGIDLAGQQQFYAMFVRLWNRPHDQDEWGLLGQLCQAQKFPELADRFYRLAIELAPDDFKWHYQSGLRLEEDGEVAGAQAAFRRAYLLNPDYAPLCMHLAWRAMEDGDTPGAMRLVDRYVELRPDDPLGYVERAQLHLDLDQWDAMEADLSKATSLGPVGGKGHRLLGVLYRHLNRPEESQFHLAMSKQHKTRDEMDDPIGITVRRLQTSRTPLLNKFAGLVRSQRYREALELADELLETYGENSENHGAVCGQLAECCRKLGKHTDAVRYAWKSVQALPGNAQSHAELALALMHAGQLQGALEAANKALELEADLHPALYARGFTQIRIAILEKNFGPSSPAVSPEARVEAGVEDLAKCVQAAPLNFSYLAALAFGHGLLQQFDQAIMAAETALRINPDDPATRDLKTKAEARANFWPVLATQPAAP